MFLVLKEPSNRDRSFEYPQHMFGLRNKKNNFQLRTFILGPDLSDTGLCLGKSPLLSFGENYRLNAEIATDVLHTISLWYMSKKDCSSFI